MSHPKRRLNPLAVITLVAAAALAACQDRKPTETPVPSASGGEYPTPSEAPPASASTPATAPGQGADVTARGAAGGTVDEAKK